MKHMITACLLLVLSGQAIAQKQSALPRISSFSIEDDTTGNFQQAGCLFYRLSDNTKLVFAYTQQALFKVDGKLHYLDALPSGDDPSLDKLLFEDRSYRVTILSRTGNRTSSGTRKGTMQVYNKKTKKSIVIRVEGICGS